MSRTKRNDMLDKNTPGVQKSEAKSEAPKSSYLYIRLKSVISDGGQGLGLFAEVSHSYQCLSLTTSLIS